jgi:hypothetical protein
LSSLFINRSFNTFCSIQCEQFKEKLSQNYEQTGTKATEIHSHHCLYCDTTFPQFNDSIKHSRENYSYHFYYCKTTWMMLQHDDPVLFQKKLRTNRNQSLYFLWNNIEIMAFVAIMSTRWILCF